MQNQSFIGTTLKLPFSTPISFSHRFTKLSFLSGVYSCASIIQAQLSQSETSTLGVLYILNSRQPHLGHDDIKFEFSIYYNFKNAKVQIKNELLTILEKKT